MAIYIIQGNYTREALQGMISKPEDRATAVAALAKAAGAKMLNYYVTFGEYDFLVIMEGGARRSATDTMATLMTAAATGGATNLKTTVAVTSKESMSAMRTAKKIQQSFRVAGT